MFDGKKTSRHFRRSSIMARMVMPSGRRFATGHEGPSRCALGRLLSDLLLRWFVGLGVDDPVWDATTFTKNGDRLPAR